MSELENTEWKGYTVSEAVVRCGVPSHVLRYWEDELGLSIERTAQGHRIYSDGDLAVFARVKELKAKGIQLKAIRLLLEDSDEGHRLGKLLGEEPGRPDGIDLEKGTEADGLDFEKADYEILPAGEADNFRRFEEILRSLIGEVVAEQNERLECVISERIHEEMEELYIQLRQEETRREAAAAEEMAGHVSKRQGILQRIREMIMIKG